jgi:hypothetical protein
MSEVSAAAHAMDLSFAATNELDDCLSDELRARVKYAVTDRRAIMWTLQANSDAIRAQALGQPLVKNLIRVERPDGCRHLEFSSAPEDLELGYFHLADPTSHEEWPRHTLIRGATQRENL